MFYVDFVRFLWRQSTASFSLGSVFSTPIRVAAAIQRIRTTSICFHLQVKRCIDLYCFLCLQLYQFMYVHRG